MPSRKDQITQTPVRRPRSRPAAESADPPGASVNMAELRELITLLRDNGLAELELENEGFRVRLRREGLHSADYGESAPPTTSSSTPKSSTQPAQVAVAAAVHPGTQGKTTASEDQDLQIIPSPIVGTFYRSPSPAADPFVKIGSTVGPETVVCIIEAMKLMNEIQSEISGEVAKIYVENGQPVEYGQALFGIKR